MWFWRGTQSAIFYYVTLSPCMEAKHKRKRRKQARAERAELEMRQPEMAHQPMAFTTNRYWEEEITVGPGPPKGWKRDSMGGGGAVKDNSKTQGLQRPANKPKAKSVFANNPNTTTFSEPTQPGASSSSEPSKSQLRGQRPSLDQKQSALDTLRDTIRSSLSPEAWNWKRYEREDEPLFGLNDAMSRMWDRARPSHNRRGSAAGPAEHRRSLSHGRQRSGTTDSDQYDYYRARHPEVNELHPPIVSQLPTKRAEVAWMLQPPPSRAVMEGKIRPGAEDMSLRKPLAIIGTTKEEEKQKRTLAEDHRGVSERLGIDLDLEENRPPPVLVASPTELDAEREDRDADEEQDTEKECEIDAKASRSASLPHIEYLKPPSKPTTSLKERSSWQLQRPPLAVIASAKSTSSIHTVTLPMGAPKSKSRNSSPASAYFAPRHGKVAPDRQAIEAPPEWDYLLEVCLPQIPPRTRSSLPSGVWV